MSQVDPTRLNRWLEAVSTTEDEELDCDALFEIIDEAVEMTASVRALLPRIARHLDHCPDCQDQFETLTAFWEESQQDAWRRLKRLARRGKSLLRRRQGEEEA